MTLILGQLFLVLFVIKLTGAAISWWWVFAPVIAWVILVPTLLVVSWLLFSHGMKTRRKP